MSDQIQKFGENMANNNLSSNSLQSNMESAKRQPKRDSRHTISDDEPTTDWTPEIPFWNVSISNLHRRLVPLLNSDSFHFQVERQL